MTAVVALGCAYENRPAIALEGQDNVPVYTKFEQVRRTIAKYYMFRRGQCRGTSLGPRGSPGVQVKSQALCLRLFAFSLWKVEILPVLRV